MSGTEAILGDDFESGGGSDGCQRPRHPISGQARCMCTRTSLHSSFIPRQLQPLDACFLGRDKELADYWSSSNPARSLLCADRAAWGSLPWQPGSEQAGEDHFPRRHRLSPPLWTSQNRRGSATKYAKNLRSRQSGAFRRSAVQVLSQAGRH